MSKLTRREELVYEIEQITYTLKHGKTTHEERINLMEAQQSCIRELIRLIKAGEK